MFVPSPWRHFAFVTFSSAQVELCPELRELLVLVKDSGVPAPGALQPARKFDKNQNIFDFL